MLRCSFSALKYQTSDISLFIYNVVIILLSTNDLSALLEVSFIISMLIYCRIWLPWLQGAIACHLFTLDYAMPHHPNQCFANKLTHFPSSITQKSFTMQMVI